MDINSTFGRALKSIKITDTSSHYHQISCIFYKIALKDVAEIANGRGADDSVYFESAVTLPA